MNERLYSLTLKDIRTTTRNGYKVLGYARLGIKINDEVKSD